MAARGRAPARVASRHVRREAPPPPRPQSFAPRGDGGRCARARAARSRASPSPPHVTPRPWNVALCNHVTRERSGGGAGEAGREDRGAAYATERGAKMADEEAERESGGPGGDLLELRRLRERLLELETGLRESREPAVQAATEYCKQLCQVRPPLPFSLPFLRALPPPAPSSPRQGVCLSVCVSLARPERGRRAGPAPPPPRGTRSRRPGAAAGGAGARCSGPGRAIDDAAAAALCAEAEWPRARCRSGPARNPHPPLRLPPPRFSRSPGPFVVLCGSAYRRALCSWRWRTGGPPRPRRSDTPPPLGAKGGRRRSGRWGLRRSPEGPGRSWESVPDPSARGSCSMPSSCPLLPSLSRTLEG